MHYTNLLLPLLLPLVIRDI